MKKNNALRVAAGLVVAVLLSTCLVSGTYAKYTTHGASSDSARVAKFGVTVTPTNGSMFSATYASDTASYTTGNTVSATTKVIAPGTSGNLTGVTLSGTPEVAVSVTNEANVRLTGWGNHCPLVVTVGDHDIRCTGTIDEFKAAIKSAIEEYHAEYAPGTDLSTKTDAAPVVTWKWEYDTSDAQDAEDTTLGNAGTADISIDIDTTVTQID